MAANFIAWVPDLVVAGGRVQTRIQRGVYRKGFQVGRLVTPKKHQAWLDRKAAQVDGFQTKMVDGFDKVAEVTGFGTVTSVATLGLSHLGKVGKLGKLSKVAVRAGKARQTRNRLRTVKAAGKALANNPQPASGVAETAPAPRRTRKERRAARVNPAVIEGELLPAAKLDGDSRAVGGGFRPATPARAISHGVADQGQASNPHIDQRFLEQVRADFPEHAGLNVENLDRAPAPAPLPQPAPRRTLSPRVAGQGGRTRSSRHLTGVR